MEEKFISQRADENNLKWNEIISRESQLYKKKNEFRTDFTRDYNRIIFSNSYRRLKSKTQVFFSPKDDHICTRIEHVNNVEAISYNIASILGLNTELTRAISVAHDLGHPPFGHKGEKVLAKLAKEDNLNSFWHEKNGLNLVDNIELLENTRGNKTNLNLTYAVRDGIVSHCGEIDENSIKPRSEFINLNEYTKPNEFAPFTWEACVVKIADKISYLGRDIEDAISIGILKEEQTEELRQLFELEKTYRINNTIIISELVSDLYINSSIEKGLAFSEKGLNIINKIKEFNYKNIYDNNRMKAPDRYFEMVITEIFNLLKSAFEEKNTLNNLEKLKETYPKTISRFVEWIKNYIDIPERKTRKLDNRILYNINKKEDYLNAVIEYISGMTDNYAMETYNDIISF